MSEEQDSNARVRGLYPDFHTPLPASETVVTIGTFAGVHRGHQHLIRQVIARARETGRPAIAITFCPHPRTVLHPEIPLAYLSTSQERISLLKQQGFDQVVVAEFTPDLAATPADVFMAAVVHQLRMRELWIGYDFRLGKDREGGPEKITLLGAQLGYTVHLVEPLLDGGRPITSTRIRELISAGNVEQAALLLGRRYNLSGQVIAGRKMGRRLGIRTANIACDPERVIPANGVYAAWADVAGQRLMAAVNIGIRPTFGESERLLEVHLLDFEEDLYDTVLDVSFVRYLRPELRFSDISLLVAQIQRDIALTRSILLADRIHEVNQEHG